MRRILFAIALSIASLSVGAVSISGSVTNNQGGKVCGLVLANGQFVFSCSPDGQYALNNVPLDASGQITIFGFADGHFPFRKVVSSGGVYDLQLTVAAAPASSNPNRDKTAQLIGGTWSYTYTIINTFTDSYSFTSINTSPDASGDYYATGTDAFGRLAVGGYNSSAGQWAVLSRGTIIDYFYTFTFSGNNNVSGCYYQISPSGSTNLSRCYSMFGSRSPAKMAPVGLPNEEQLAFEARQDRAGGFIEPNALETYLRLRDSLPQ